LSSDQAQGLLSSYTFPDELRTGELLLRAPQHEDVDTVAPAFLDPAVGGEAGLPPFDAETLHTVLDGQLVEMRRAGLMSPYLVEDTTTGAILGGAGLHHLDPMRDVVELGYWLFADARGRGIATRVVNALAEDAFARGINRVEAVVRLDNAASERVLERAGFTREGVRRRLLSHGGRRVDASLFSRLVGE
jgi:RimJ/RimL family protein N-acetyltransferase